MAYPLRDDSLWTMLRAWWRERRGLVAPRPEDHTAGADYVPGQALYPVYDAAKALAAVGTFPLVYATLNRSADDLSGLPLRAGRGTPGGKLRPVPQHPFLRLLERPSPDVSGVLFRRQLVLDRRASGNAYALKLYTARGDLMGLRRLHPEAMHPVTNSYGQIIEYVYRHGGAEQRYDRRAILHVRGTAWAAGPAETFGTGMVEPLNRTLTADDALQNRLTVAAKQGRPAAVVSPDNGDSLQAVWTPEKTAEMRRTLAKASEAATGGLMLLGTPLRVQPLDYSPEELQAQEGRAALMREVLAVAGVPPIRIGLETANYATAQQQAEVYWGDELTSEAALLDAELSYHAQLDYGPNDVWIYHDFTGVPALQSRRDGQIARVTGHILNGMDPADAYPYEGLEDAPVAVAAPAPAPQKATGDWWDGPPAVVVRAAPAASWSRWRNQLARPAEVALARTSRAYLGDARARVLDRFDASTSERSLQRNVVADLVAWLWPAAESTTMSAQYLDTLGRILEAAARYGAATVQGTYDPDRLDPLAQAQVAQLVTNVSQATRDELAALIQGVLADGGAYGDIRTALERWPGFGPARALRIARTEATSAVSAGTTHAWRATAAEQDVAIQKRWLARPSSRAAHQTLDRMTVGLHDRFIVPSGPNQGAGADAPGGFGVAALDINCTCGLAPVVA